MSRSLMNSRIDKAVPDRTEDITRIISTWIALMLRPGGTELRRPNAAGVARTKAATRIGMRAVVIRKTRPAAMTRRYLRAIVNTWLRLLRCLGRVVSPSG